MRESVLLVVGAVVAVVLQIVLAPNLVILGSMPDLVLVYVALLPCFCDVIRCL